MANKILKLKLDASIDHVYWISNGDLWRAPKTTTRDRAEKPTRCYKKLDIETEPGWVYFLDKDGDVSRARPRRKRS